MVKSVVIPSHYTNIERAMHFLNLHWAECKQQQQHSDDKLIGIFTF